MVEKSLKYGFALSCLFLLVFVFSRPTVAQTLKQALENAYATNPSLLAQRADLRKTDESVPKALGNWRPKIELSGDLQRQYTNNNTRGDVDVREQMRTISNGTLTLTQSLFRGFRTLAEVKQAENSVLSKRAGLIGTEQDILLSAATEYLSVMQSQAVVALNKKNEEVLKRQLEATRDRFRVGEITRTDVSQAEARLAGATATRIKSEGDLKISRASYVNVIGKVPGTLKKPGLLTGLPENLDEAKKMAVTNHPDIIASRLALETADEGVKVSRGALYPTLNMVGTFKRDWESINHESQVTTGEVKLDLTIPLYQKGTVMSGLREAKISAGKSRLDLENTRRTVSENVESAWESLKSAQGSIQSIKAQIVAAHIALEGVEREASVGSRTVLDVLDAEQELLDAKVSLIGAERDEILACFKLKESIGQLTAAGINLSVELYDPTQYYKRVRNKIIGVDPPLVGPIKD